MAFSKYPVTMYWLIRTNMKNPVRVTNSDRVVLQKDT